MNEGFTQNLNGAPTKLSVIAYNTNITYIFLVDDPMEHDWLVYSQNIPNLFLVGGPIKLAGLCMHI